MIAGLVYAFVFTMWLLILVGGGLMVTIVGPLSFGGSEGLDPILNSGVKILIAILLIVLWIVILSKIKNWIFRKQIKS